MPALDDIETVGVVGAGTMGSGIAQVAATAGYDVVMRDVESTLVADGRERIADSLDRFVSKDAHTRGEADAALDRIAGTTDLDELAPADLVVEAVVEDMNVKQDVFADLDTVTDDDGPPDRRRRLGGTAPIGI